MKLIVTAGGKGTKLWPLSRNATPKQFQPIIDSKSTFTQNIETLLQQYQASDIFISTKRKYVKHVLDQAPQISFNNLIIEPDFEKNRGPGEGLAFLKMSLFAPDEPFMIIQSDVLRLPGESFLEYMQESEKVVRKERKFLTGGKKAISPDMGADYLKLGNLVEKTKAIEFYECDSFVERIGDFRAAEKLIADYHVVVHVNHFTCYPEMILKAYEEYRPDWYQALMSIKEIIGVPDEEERLNRIYESMEAGPTEMVTTNVFNSDKTIIALTNFDWIDLGTWASVKEYNGKYGTNRKKNLIIDSEDVYGKAKDGKLVVIYGVDNVVVVDTDDALLVINKDQTGKVGDILKELKKKDFDSFL